MKVTANLYFAGGGLMSLGFQRAGVEIQQSFELDPTCCKTLRKNFRSGVVQCDFSAKTVADTMPAHVHVYTYPCNKYSPIADIHEGRTGDDLYLHAFRHIAIARPELYVLENVPGMRMFPVVMEAMTRLPGYYVKVFCPVSAQLWLPQVRDRLIIFASRRPFDWRPPGVREKVSLASIIEKDPEVRIPNYVYSRLAGKYRDHPIVSDPARGDVAPTCVAHYAKDLSTRLVTDRRFKLGVRPYSVREYARLQGVPDSYQFEGTASQQYKQIGNGVAIPMAEWAGRETMRYFAHGRRAA